MFDRRRAPIEVPASSRAFANEILAELSTSGWSARAWLRFLARSTARSWQQAVRHRAAAGELTAEHALLFVLEPGAWPVTSWLLAVTHLGLLGEGREPLGWPNRLSLLRANLPALVRAPAPWSALVALASDFGDGWLARRGTPTAFGGYADALGDIAFWTWFVWHHEPRRPIRMLATGLWLGPGLAITVAYFVRGTAVEPPRMVAVRNVSVALQAAVALRALSRREPGQVVHS